MTHDDLAERIEAVEGGDRALDWEIHCRNGLEGVGGYGAHPQYTSSLDAAMTLVPADRWNEIKGPRKYLNIPSPAPNYWSALLANWNHERDVMGWAATPALALCAAAIRARNT